MGQWRGPNRNHRRDHSTPTTTALSEKRSAVLPRMRENWGAGGSAEGENHYGKQRNSFFKKWNGNLSYRSAIPLWGLILPKSNENLYPHEHLRLNGYSTIIQNSHKPRTTQLSFYWGMDKQEAAYSYNRVPFSNERNQALIWATARMKLKDILLVKEAQYKRLRFLLLFHFMECPWTDRKLAHGYLGLGPGTDCTRAGRGLFFWGWWKCPKTGCGDGCGEHRQKEV